jgi:hypothetical protein
MRTWLLDSAPEAVQSAGLSSFKISKAAAAAAKLDRKRSLELKATGVYGTMHVFEIDLLKQKLE